MSLSGELSSAKDVVIRSVACRVVERVSKGHSVVEDALDWKDSFGCTTRELERSWSSTRAAMRGFMA